MRRITWMFWLLLVTSVFSVEYIYAEDDSDDDDEFDFVSVYNPDDVNRLARSDISTRLQPLGFGLMGDSIDYSTGTMVLNHTDVSLPGNSELEVAIRRYSSMAERTEIEQDFFGDWILDIPNISSISGG